MAHDQNFRDESGVKMGWLAVITFVAVPVLPAVLAWYKFFAA